MSKDQFWNFVIDDLFKWAGIVIGLGAIVVFIIWMLSTGVYFFWMTGRMAYQVIRYERHGVCSKCKKPYVETLVKSAGQLYGPSTITQGVCPNGHVGIPSGNRRFADW